MQTKAYFASSVPAALEVARQELGENAMLVSSRPTPPQVRQFGRLEVTFAWDPKDAPRQANELRPVEPRQPELGLARRTTAASLPAVNPTAFEMDEIRKQLSALRATVGRAAQSSDNPPVATEETFESNLMVERLVEAGLSRRVGTQVASAAARRSESPEMSVVQEIASRIPVAPFVEMKAGESRTLAFIGPPGRGKTTSLVKIAVNLGLARRVPVRIYCAGAHCVGAQEQMARFAAILGTPYHACESLASLHLALNGEGWKGLTLIDTPGISPADREEMAELKSFFTTRPEIEKHLVLRADASSADMGHMVARFTDLTPTRLLFTGTDEAVQAGSVLETLISAGIPATFAGTGQQIPDDLEEVNADRLARAIWGPPTDATANSTQRKFARAAA